MLNEIDNAKRWNYVRIKNFTDNVKKSKILTYSQKNELYSQAKKGDLDGALRKYELFMSVRKEGGTI